MQPFSDSVHLLGDASALRSQLADDGYLLLRGVLPVGRLTDLRRRLTEVCAAHGWLRPGSDPMEALAEGVPCYEGERPYLTVYDDVQRLEALHALPHDRALMAVVRALLGDTAFPHPLSIARLAFPGGETEATPPHQDYPNNQGTEELLTCWAPLSECPEALGGLAVLRGSHRLGLLPRDFAIGPGYRRAVLDGRHAGLEWVGGDFHLGDLLVFHSLTVHRALPNRTDRIRLSVDYRYQREGEALIEQSLLPHYGRLSWDEIYSGWDREELRYYWRSRRFSVVPGDPGLLDLAPGHLEQSMVEWMAWRHDHPERDPDLMAWFLREAGAGPPTDSAATPRGGAG